MAAICLQLTFLFHHLVLSEVLLLTIYYGEHVGNYFNSNVIGLRRARGLRRSCGSGASRLATDVFVDINTDVGDQY